MTMGIRHSEAANRVALEVEFDQHHRLLADDPTVVARLDRHNLRSFVFHHAAVGVFNVDFATRQEADVGVHAEVGADDRFHVDRPAKPARIDHALHARGAGTSDLEPDMADCAALGPLHRIKQRIRRLRPGLASFRDPGGALDVLSGGLLFCNVSLLDRPMLQHFAAYEIGPE